MLLHQIATDGIFFEDDMSTTPTVFVVDDDPATREWVSGLARSVGLNVAAFASADDFIKGYELDTPGCLLLDVRLPKLSGLELQALLHERRIGIPIIMMSAFGEVGVAVQAMKAGAVDFIEKPCSGQGLLDRIHRAIAVDAESRETRGAVKDARERVSSLSPREHEVLEGILEGKANKVIAADLGISEKTVEARRAILMQKMGAHSIAELIRLALLTRSGT